MWLLIQIFKIFGSEFFRAKRIASKLLIYRKEKLKSKMSVHKTEQLRMNDMVVYTLTNCTDLSIKLKN